MDNLAHTLVGAALGRAVGAGRVPRAALIGAVAANAPDWAEYFIGFRGSRIDYYTLHRGITHSFLGAAVEIAALTLLVGIGAAWWARRRGAAPPAWGWIGLCIGATVASHLFMDWQGSYGLRPFLPWSGQRYYGDWVAIVDAFYWLVPLIALAWGAPRHWRFALLFGGLLSIMCAVLVVNLGRVVPWVSAVFFVLVVIAGVGWINHWFGVRRSRWVATAAMVVLAVYSLAHGAAAHFAKREIQRVAVARFGPAARSAALTAVGRPFSWEPIYASADTVAGTGWAVPRHLGDPRVQQVLADTKEGRAMVQFARFLTAQVDSTSTGIVVVLRDARYARRGGAGWAVVAIRRAGG
jgi:membrane-bound metal-dependent hydrolase YbcI (DUF457 family)